MLLRYCKQLFALGNSLRNKDAVQSEYMLTEHAPQALRRLYAVLERAVGEL